MASHRSATGWDDYRQLVQPPHHATLVGASPGEMLAVDVLTDLDDETQSFRGPIKSVTSSSLDRLGVEECQVTFEDTEDNVRLQLQVVYSNEQAWGQLRSAVVLVSGSTPTVIPVKRWLAVERWCEADHEKTLCDNQSQSFLRSN